MATTTKSAPTEMKLSVHSLEGKELKTIQLSEILFNGSINESVVAQYIRVYRSNNRQGTHSTKTRSEVKYSTKKIYRQKGTGGARHGSRRAPIFVGGGITFGPKPRDYSLSMNKKQKRIALVSALTQSYQEGKLRCIAVPDADHLKTKIFTTYFKAQNIEDKRTLMVIDSDEDIVAMGIRNIPKVTASQFNLINPYQILTSHNLVFTENALIKLEEHFKN